MMVLLFGFLLVGVLSAVVSAAAAGVRPIVDLLPFRGRRRRRRVVSQLVDDLVRRAGGWDFARLLVELQRLALAAVVPVGWGWFCGRKVEDRLGASIVVRRSAARFEPGHPVGAEAVEGVGGVLGSCLVGCAVLLWMEEPGIMVGAGDLALTLKRIEANDQVYTQRFGLVLLALAQAAQLGFEAGIGLDDRADPNFPVVAFIELPTGQVSWHMPLHRVVWDGHSTLLKYERCRTFAASVG